MKTLKISAIVTLILGVISLLWLVADFAALTDIWHNNEPNLDAEWWVVSRGFIPLTLFHLSTLVTLFVLFNKLRKQQINFGKDSQ
jgi:hypothetical protein